MLAGAMMPTALLTGGAGYIGGHAALALQDAGWQVIIVDDLSTGSREGIMPDTVFYEGDIGDAELLNTIFNQHSIDAVLHFAAVASVPESTANPARCDKINRQGSSTLIGMDKNGVFSPNSPYKILKCRYLPELPDGRNKENNDERY